MRCLISLIQLGGKSEIENFTKKKVRFWSVPSGCGGLSCELKIIKFQFFRIENVGKNMLFLWFFMIRTSSDNRFQKNDHFLENVTKCLRKRWPKKEGKVHCKWSTGKVHCKRWPTVLILHKKLYFFVFFVQKRTEDLENS